MGSRAHLAEMERVGLTSTTSLGVRTPEIRRMAKQLGRDTVLAAKLWDTGIHEVRVLATMVADPRNFTLAQADKWVGDIQSWGVCDAFSYQLCDATPWAETAIRKWAKDEREFVRRAAFATIAGRAVHAKKSPDAEFLAYLPLIEQYAFDDRNFVRKAVNWALRQIGKRSAGLLPAAIACAERVQRQGTKSARWIAADALRELRQR